MKRIGVLSDTHGKLREEVREILKSCDVILHAGDINTPQVMESLKAIAPLYIVRGNADKEWAEGIPETLSEEICGLHMFMVHNKKYFPKDIGKYDLVVFGHSHKYEERREGSCLYLNPGSCGPRRFTQPVTMAVLEVDRETGTVRVIRKDIVQEPMNSPNQKSTEAAPAGQRQRQTAADESQKAENEQFPTDKLRMILRDIDKRKSVSAIAAKYGISKETTEQICRLYLTHPGIDAAGVREKMGLPKDR